MRPNPAAATFIATLACFVVGLACSAGSGSGPADAGSDTLASIGPCVAGYLVLGGPDDGTPHGSYLLTNSVFATGSFSASLPASGSLQLDWTGDPTSGPVAITGELSIPGEDEGPPVVWCIDSPASLHISGHYARLALTITSRGTTICSPTGAADAGVPLHVATACADVSTS